VTVILPHSLNDNPLFMLSL